MSGQQNNFVSLLQILRDSLVQKNILLQAIEQKSREQEAIVKKRMAVAKSLLSSEKSLPIYTIASMCGYTDQSAFYRRFKKEYGLSPSEYAQKKRTEQL